MCHHKVIKLLFQVGNLFIYLFKFISFYRFSTYGHFSVYTEGDIFKRIEKANKILKSLKLLFGFVQTTFTRFLLRVQLQKCNHP